MKHSIWLISLFIATSLHAGAPVLAKTATQTPGAGIGLMFQGLRIPPEGYFPHQVTDCNYPEVESGCCWLSLDYFFQKPKSIGSSTETRLTDLEMKLLKLTGRQEVKLGYGSAPLFNTGFELSGFKQH